MNYRNRELLNLAYELDCTLRIPGCCTGGTGEPAHANEAIWGKGGAMKAHDFAFASGCRGCHRELDQGKNYSEDAKHYFWLRGHVETMRQLWERGLLVTRREGLPGNEVAAISNGSSLPPSRRRKSKCTASDKQVKRPQGGFAA